MVLIKELCIHVFWKITFSNKLVFPNVLEGAMYIKCMRVICANFVIFNMAEEIRSHI